ncbi:MAG TPA: MlaD family protein [Thermoleophilaceae bacterium]|nr:MlaD family protein [Thermoleophilaceae bacterium]
MSKRSNGMSPFRAGVLALVLVGLFTYFGFTKANPFANPYEFKAVFNDVNNLKPKSPVRIAGVEVGKVLKVEPVSEGKGAAQVTMEVDDKGLPIKKDAELKIRPRIFLEGNFFVDLKPGSPTADELDDGGVIPVTQTAAPVQWGDLLTALQSDTRSDLQTFLREYSKGLEDGGSEGFNQAIRYWEPAYRYSSLSNDATLGKDPDHDLQRVLRGQQKTFAAIVKDEDALKDLVTNFNVTAAAFAREDEALAASIPALRDTLKVGHPALESLDTALPSLRAFARDALPGVRSSDETLAESLPFITQARLLMSEPELRGTARVLRQTIPDVVAFNRTSVPFLRENRALSACTNNVLVPFMHLKIPNPESGNEAENSDQEVRAQLQRGFPGLSGESRLSDGNNQYVHAGATPPGDRVRPGPPPDGGSMPMTHRPDIPCEEQELPNLHAPGGPIPAFPVLQESPGSVVKPPAPTPPLDSFLDAAQKFVDDTLPLITQEREAYARREARLAKQEGGG